MQPTRFAVAALTLVCLTAAPFAQEVTAPLPDAAAEEFLRKARIVSTRSISTGVTGSTRATLSDGTLTHDAHIQTVDQTKAEFRGKEGVERDFRDAWQYNVAAYKVDRLLDLQLVPVTVERTWRGSGAAFTWWVDDVMMDEGERLKKDIPAPDSRCWMQQGQLLRMLDQLIDNVDRNLGNLVITKHWRMWAIDHTRAFRRTQQPRSITGLRQIDRGVLERLKALDEQTLRREIGRYVGRLEIRALLSRRDALVAHYEARGDAALFDRDPPAAGCGGA